MSDARVVSETRMYSPTSQHSFFRDQMLAAGLNGYSDPQARERLRRHMVEVQAEVVSDSAEGRRALREQAETVRDDDRFYTRDAIAREARDRIGRLAAQGEVRAATTATISGFTTPQYITSQFAKYRGTQRCFVDQMTELPMPDVGMQIHVPRFTATASAGAQSEGSSLNTLELDPTGADIAANVQMIAGQVIASQQLIDRTTRMPDGPTFDFILAEQLQEMYDQSLNQYGLGVAMSQGAQVTGASTFGSANALAALYTDLAAAHDQLIDTAGNRLKATHLITTPDLFMYMSKQLDDQHRPVLMPSMSPGVPPTPVGDDDGIDTEGKWYHFTGSVVPGVMFWFIDPTIQPTGSTVPWIVSRPEKILLFEGAPITRVFAQTIADKMQVVVQYYAYAAVLPRFPGATAVVNGAAYLSSLK